MSRLQASPAAPVAVRTDGAALGAGLFTVTLWGSAFVGIRLAGASLSPASLALGRLLVSCALLGLVAVARRDPLPTPRDLMAIAAFGVVWLGAYSVTLNAAERTVDAGTSALLVNTGPIIVAILAGLFLHEGFPRRLFVGCAIAFAGTVMIGLATTHQHTRAALGIFLLIVAAIAYSTAVVVQKPVLARVPPFQVTFLGVVAATIACLPFAPGLAADISRSSPGAVAWMLYLGAFPTAIGFATWAFALRRTSAGRLGSLTYLAPVVAVVLSWILLGETPPWLALVGGALCLAGVYVARRPPRTQARDS